MERVSLWLERECWGPAAGMYYVCAEFSYPDDLPVEGNSVLVLTYALPEDIEDDIVSTEGAAYYLDPDDAWTAIENWVNTNECKVIKWVR